MKERKIEEIKGRKESSMARKLWQVERRDRIVPQETMVGLLHA